MQIVLPVPSSLGTRRLRSALSISQRYVAPRSAWKLTNGPLAVALARNVVGVNAAAIARATSAGFCFLALAMGKQPPARSPSPGGGGASTLRSPAEIPE